MNYIFLETIIKATRRNRELLKEKYSVIQKCSKPQITGQQYLSLAELYVGTTRGKLSDIKAESNIMDTQSVAVNVIMEYCMRFVFFTYAHCCLLGLEIMKAR